MAKEQAKEKGISPAIVIIPLGLGLGLAAALVLAAMAKAATPTPPPGRAVLYGKVTDADSGAPAAGALITLDSMTTYSGADGNYTLNDIAPGSYNITVEHTGHNTFSQSLTLTEGSNQLNVQMSPVAAPPAAADIRVESLNISPTQVNVGERVIVSVTAKNYGSASGSKTITLTVNGTPSSQTVTLAPNQSQQINFEVTPHDAKTYNVSVDGLAGSFEAIQIPTLPFTYTFSCTRGTCPSATAYGIAQMSGTIKNNNSVLVSQNVKVMWSRWSKTYGKWVSCAGQFVSVREYCLVVSACIVNPFPVSLSPGAQQSFSYKGYCNPDPTDPNWQSCDPALMANYNYYFWLEDDAGGKTNEVVLST